MEKKDIKKKREIVDLTVQVCKYDPLKDAQKVVEGLGVSVDDMLQTGIVKNSSETLDNNGIDEPDRIIGRIRDIFDALDASRVVKKYGKSAKKQDSAVKEIVSSSDTKPTNE